MLNSVQITASDGAQGDHFGSSVAISGDTVLVGADGKNSNTGAVYTYIRNGTSWTQQDELTAGDGASGDWFGISAAISGDTALVGAYGKNSYTGAAYIYVWNGTRWTQQAKLTASDGAQGDYFGSSVAISGDTALVGAYGKNSYTGAAYIYVRNGADWTQQVKLIASDGASDDYFGSSVAISGNTALVGAYKKNSRIGAVYIYVRDGTTWTQQAELSDGALHDGFGYSVAIIGDTALVGAPYKHTASVENGAAYIYVRNGTTWIQQAELAGGHVVLRYRFGVSVAISGDSVLIGAPDGVSTMGWAYIYVWNGTTWIQQAKLTESYGTSGDRFGVSVAISGDTALVGASAWSSTGAVYIYLTSTPPSRGIKFFEGSPDCV